MKYLLDTHALIWFLDGDSQLPKKIVKEIKDQDNYCFVSIAAVWEIAVKSSIGKLKMKVEFDRLEHVLSQNDLRILPVEFEHLKGLSDLPWHHRDPFDRLMISQAISDNLVVITTEKQFKNYPIKCLW